jgi:hypothetical protein
LFNKQFKEEIILEPERKYVVRNAIPPSRNKIIHIRCEIKDSPDILEKVIIADFFRIKYKFNKKYRCIKIFGYDFLKKIKIIAKLYTKMKHMI